MKVEKHSPGIQCVTVRIVYFQPLEWTAALHAPVSTFTEDKINADSSLGISFIRSGTKCLWTATTTHDDGRQLATCAYGPAEFGMGFICDVKAIRKLLFSERMGLKPVEESVLDSGDVSQTTKKRKPRPPLVVGSPPTAEVAEPLPPFPPANSNFKVAPFHDGWVVSTDLHYTQAKSEADAIALCSLLKAGEMRPVDVKWEPTPERSQYLCIACHFNKSGRMGGFKSENEMRPCDVCGQVMPVMKTKHIL